MEDYKLKVHTLTLMEQEVMAIEYELIVSKRNYYPRFKSCSAKEAVEFIKSISVVRQNLSIIEVAGMLCLNRANYVTGFKILSQGGVSGTIIDPKIVAKYAVDTLSCAVILWHNHPSGQLKPSDSDLSLTKKVKEGLDLLDIKLLDNLIITDTDEYYSFAQEGIL